ncbi:hypothetical protein G9A89_008662 [Geosiphon pyriformis]|nr:hypothetical protein G9A89_008662 [Geosiphon pyriformis]
MFMALGSMSNWADKTEQEHFTPHSKPETPGWNIPYSKPKPRKQCSYILLKFKGGTPFDAAYNNTLNKLYHYPHDAEMIFDLAMALINRATQENVCQMKESEYIAYTFEIVGYNYENEVECPECYAFSILLPSKNNENKIEFGEPEATEEIETTPIYLIKSQPALQLKYFNNNEQGIKLEKAHEIDAEYDLRYPDKNTLVLKPKSLTKINLKIALEIPPGVMIQIVSRFFLASKEINVRGGIIDAGYTGDITVMLQNEIDKSFKIDHVEKIVQAIYLPLINILGLQLVNQREQLGKSDRETQGFVPVNIALKTQNKSHQSNKQVCLKHNILILNIYIPEETKKTVPNFLEIIGHSLPKINPNPSSENYHVLKELIVEFANIFAENNNDLGRTNLEMPNQKDNKHIELLQKATNSSEKKYNECLTTGSSNPP